MKEKNSNLVVIFTALMGMVLMAGVRAEGPEPKVARMQVFDNFVGWEEVAHSRVSTFVSRVRMGCISRRPSTRETASTLT